MAAEERLSDLAARREAERFVGRDEVLALVDGALDGRSDVRIVYLHGPGGVGKSAIVRAVGRRADEAGRPVVRVDGRLVGPTLEHLRAVVAPASASGSVLLVDEVDAVASLRRELRDLVLATVPATGTVVVAGRAAPDRAWFDGELQSLVAVVAVRPLDRDDARELLRRHQVADPEEVDRVVRWAAGYPLALTLASSLAATDGPVEASPAPPSAGGDLDGLLLERLGGHELRGVDPDVLDVAAIAPAVDGPLLATVLPGRATRSGVTALRELSIAEPFGARTTLHPLARAALRTRLAKSDPDRCRTLTVRIARHLHRRALGGDPSAALELATLVEDPELRLGVDPSTTHYADVPRPGDIEAMAACTGAGSTAWFARLARWCEEQPGVAIAVRRTDGTLSGMSVIGMASAMPDWAEDDIETGPVLRWLRQQGIAEEAALTHDTVILEDPDDLVARAEVVRVGNAGAMAMGAVRNPRYVFATAAVDSNYRGIAPLRYAPVEPLSRRDDERELITLSTDFGPDGIIGQMLRLVLSEQGEGPAADQPESEVPGHAVVVALRAFHDDDVLAASPLAPATGSVTERAEAARQQARDAVDRAFGPSPGDQLLRAAIERTYLDPAGGHGVAQRELHMSRSSFYRHLQKARDRVADAS